MVSVAQLHRAHPLADAADDGASSSPRFGRYRLLGRLAMGGMAEVWAGELRGRSGLRTPVVIKRVRAELACDPRFVQQFVTEARVATRLSHANICEVFELGDVDGELYLAMEYLRGASVRQVLRHGALAPGLAAAVVAGAAAGLDYAHRLTDERSGAPLGIVHRDVSPDNLFVAVDGTVKLLDFGIAKICDGLSEATEAGRLKGKLGYMAPEQLAGAACDQRVDVWALGVVLWEMLTGRRLFKGPMAEVIARIRAVDVPPLAAHGLPHPPLERVVRGALAHDPAARFPTVAAFAEALAAAIAPGAEAGAAALAALVRARCGAEVEQADLVFVDGAATIARPRPVALPEGSDPSIVIEPAAPPPVRRAAPVAGVGWAWLARLLVAAVLMGLGGYALAILTRPTALPRPASGPAAPPVRASEPVVRPLPPGAVP